LHGPEREEAGSDQQVAFPEARGFDGKTEEPLEPVALHPGRGLAGAASVEIEGCTDADHGDAGETGAVFGHPPFLLGRADADEDEVGVGMQDELTDAGVLGCRERAEGRRVRPGDRQAREAFAKAAGQQGENVFAAAVEEDALADAGGFAAEFEHERGAVDALLMRGAEGAHSPDEGHAIGRCDVGFVEDAGDVRIVVRQDDAVDGRDADVAGAGRRRRFAFLGPRAAESDDFGVARPADADVDDLLFFGRGKRHGDAEMFDSG